MPPKRKSSRRGPSDVTEPLTKSARVAVDLNPTAIADNPIESSGDTDSGARTRPEEELERIPFRRGQVIYQVFRTNDDSTGWDAAHTTVEEDVLCKTFSDLEQANEYAKGFLLAEWDRDAFESYDVSTNQDGLVTVNAIFLEGETGTVEVRKLGTNTKPVEGSWNVWILLEKNGDDSGWKIKGVFQSKSGAMIALENRAVELGEVEKVAGVKYRIVEGGRDGPDPMYARRIAADGDYETVLRMEKWPVKS